ncbi:hypothetical protein PEPMIC_00881 [Parvimonas micra ATCC 33270]|uniref:Uncharacterized protein n=1 Tax=Parvimonas micra ATCC 33270 TaxID=411465 RepID=A8SL61_9FIRM|nr:hypothetical protein PEPMIC_00881 [Parvimonas micra ATCC 33270]
MGSREPCCFTIGAIEFFSIAFFMYYFQFDFCCLM